MAHDSGMTRPDHVSYGARGADWAMPLDGPYHGGCGSMTISSGGPSAWPRENAQQAYERGFHSGWDARSKEIERLRALVRALYHPAWAELGPVAEDIIDNAFSDVLPNALKENQDAPDSHN